MLLINNFNVNINDHSVIFHLSPATIVYRVSNLMSTVVKVLLYSM
jgi:hypothetical protein